MKEIKQTEFGATGNCFSACIASLFEWPIEEVPNFSKYGSKWFDEVEKWINKKGYYYFQPSEPWPIYQWCDENFLFIATGHSPRGKFYHCVIWGKDGLVFDPHPDNTGIVGDPVGYGYFIKLFK